MIKNTNTCLVTAKQVAAALAIYSTDDQTGESIAQDMLDGVIQLSPEELDTLARYKGVGIYALARTNKNDNMIKTVIFYMLEGFTTEQLIEILDKLYFMRKF